MDIQLNTIRRTWKGAVAVSERLTHSDVFGGILTNSEINHFGGAHTGTEVAYCGEPIDKLFEIENMCYDADGNELISLARLRELAEAEREGRVVVLPVAVDELAYTPEGDAIVKNWDITARVTFCVPHRSGIYWSDKYSDFDILDILNPEAERALAAADAGKGENNA